MRHQSLRVGLCLAIGTLFLIGSQSTLAAGDINKVNHIIVVMQENHSFDNYFGALAYAPGSPYHNGDGACDKDDHSCIDGLTCRPNGMGALQCSNSNVDENGKTVFAFHDTRRCVLPDLDHSWLFTHFELNFLDPNKGFKGLNNGFVRVNRLTEGQTENQTMKVYNQNEIPFYYDLAQKFAIGDRYFASVLGPTFPNRSYLLAATSFGHLTTNDTFPPPGGYKPITGTILDLLDANGISWGGLFPGCTASRDFPCVHSSVRAI